MEPFKDLSDVDLFELKERTERASIDLCVWLFFVCVWQFIRFLLLFAFALFVFISIFHCSKVYWKVVPSSHCHLVWFVVDFFYRFTAILRRSNRLDERYVDSLAHEKIDVDRMLFCVPF